MQATMATNRSIAWINKDHFDTRSERLVPDHLLQLPKAPLVHAFDLASLANSSQIFEHDPLIVRFGEFPW